MNMRSMRETLKAAWVGLLSRLFPTESVDPDAQVQQSYSMDSSVGIHEVRWDNKWMGSSNFGE